MSISIGTAVGIIDLIAALFGRGGRAARIAKILDEVPGQLMAYKSARLKIDTLEAAPDVETYDVRFTHAELLAVWRAHDLIRRSGRELRQLIRRL